MSRLGDATRAHHDALAQLAAVYADEITAGGGTPRDVADALELLRAQLHRDADALVDAEEQRQPGKPTFRARRYHAA